MENNTCSYMPALVKREGKSEREYLDELYEIFRSDFYVNQCSYLKSPVYLCSTKVGDLEQAFRQLTQYADNFVDKDRFNKVRCERLRWIRAILNNESCKCEDKLIKFTDPNSHKRKRILIWCKSENYLIILEDRTKYYLLINAYCLIYDRQRREVERKYKERQEMN